MAMTPTQTHGRATVELLVRRKKINPVCTKGSFNYLLTPLKPGTDHGWGTNSYLNLKRLMIFPSQREALARISKLMQEQEYLGDRTEYRYEIQPLSTQEIKRRVP